MSEIEIIKQLQTASGPFLDALMHGVTQLGTELILLGIAAVLFWCCDKRAGFKFINIFIAGQLVTGLIKSAVKRPRPYQSGAAAIKERTGGYSFPSGHSQNIANISTQSALMARKTEVFLPVLITGAALTLFVMFTRMYLGQHYLTDVIVGAALGVAVALGISRLFELLKDGEEKLMYVMLPLSVAVAAVMLIVGAESNDLFKALGAYGAVTLGYYLEKRFIRYEVKAALWKQVIKVLVGIAVMLLIKDGIKAIFKGVDGILGCVISYARYFGMGIWATCLAPLLFKAVKL